VFRLTIIIILTISVFELIKINSNNYKIFKIYHDNEYYINRTTSQNEFRSVFRKLSNIYHPDKAKTNFNEEKWNLLKNCYEIFSKDEFHSKKMLFEIIRDQTFVLNSNNFEKISYKDSTLDNYMQLIISSLSGILLLTIFLFWTESPNDSFVKILLLSYIFIGALY